jgi:hypothetical protein
MKMRKHREMILEAMDSMLASAQLEALPGITLQKFLIELELFRQYPKKGETGKFTPGQVRYIKRVLDGQYKAMEIDGQKYYAGQGWMI